MAKAGADVAVNFNRREAEAQAVFGGWLLRCFAA
jgi:hypothetical protein